jgi:hypothetical protein
MLQKSRKPSEYLHNNNSTLQTPAETLVWDHATVKYNEGIVCWQFIPNNVKDME